MGAGVYQGSPAVESILASDTPILIVDDNPQYMRIFRTILKNAFGYTRITQAESPEKALELIYAEPDYFRMLFVDYHFPGELTGVDLLRELNQAHMLENKIAFIFTSNPTGENVKEAAAEGALGVIAKPIERDELEKQLQKAERYIREQSTEVF